MLKLNAGKNLEDIEQSSKKIKKAQENHSNKTASKSQPRPTQTPNQNPNTMSSEKSRKSYCNKLYLIQRINMAKLLFNSEIPKNEIKAIENLYLERMNEIRQDSFLFTQNGQKYKNTDFLNIDKIEDIKKIEVTN